MITPNQSETSIQVMTNESSPSMEHILVLKVPVHREAGNLHGSEHVPPSLLHYPGGEQGAGVLQLLQGDLHQTCNSQQSSLVKAKLSTPSPTSVQGCPGVYGEGQHGVEVVMVVTPGREQLQSPQGASTQRILAHHILNQSEANIQVTRSLWSNQRPISSSFR